MIPSEERIQTIIKTLARGKTQRVVIEKLLGVSRSTAQRSMSFLQSAGIAECEHHVYPHGRNAYWKLSVPLADIESALDLYAERNREYQIARRKAYEKRIASRNPIADTARRIIKAGSEPPPFTTGKRSVFELGTP